METIKQFRFGWARDSWDNLSAYLRKVGFSEKEIIDAGLGIKGQRGIYDRFRGRVMLPIANHHGQVVGFTGRVADFLPSYKKTKTRAESMSILRKRKFTTSDLFFTDWIRPRSP